MVEGDGGTQIIETATGRTVATLPGGLLAPSKDLVVRVAPEGASTHVQGTDLAGKPLLDVALPGNIASRARTARRRAGSRRTESGSSLCRAMRLRAVSR